MRVKTAVTKGSKVMHPYQPARQREQQSIQRATVNGSFPAKDATAEGLGGDVFMDDPGCELAQHSRRETLRRSLPFDQLTDQLDEVGLTVDDLMEGDEQAERIASHLFRQTHSAMLASMLTRTPWHQTQRNQNTP